MDRRNRLYVVRHGQISGYDRFPVYGHTDVDITEVGRLQMENLADRLRLAEIGVIYSSDLRRSVKGARIIGRYHDVPLHALPELRELYFGDWEGMTLSEIHERFPAELDRRQADILNFTPPGGGETIGHLSDRVMACFKGVLERHEGKGILLVGHGAVNRVILCHALGLDLSRIFHLQQDYGCLNIIDYFEDTTLVRLVNG